MQLLTEAGGIWKISFSDEDRDVTGTLPAPILPVLNEADAMAGAEAVI